VLYLRTKSYKITVADGSKRDRKGCKIFLRDLKTGKDTVVPVPAIDGRSAMMWMSMTAFDPAGKTLIVPAGRDANKNDFLDRTEKCKPGLYDIASGKLTTLDVEGNMIFPTFHPDGKTLVVTAIEGRGAPGDVKVYSTPSDKIKFRTLSQTGLIRSISPTSGLMAMLLKDKFVLYDLKSYTVKAELGGRDEIRMLYEHNPQWTSDGRYLYYIKRKEEMRDGRRGKKFLTRIWDAQAGKEAGLIPGTPMGIAPLGPGPGKGTMVLTRPTIIPGRRGGTQMAMAIVLHAQDDKMLGDKLHPLGDTSMQPISTQGKWLLFIRDDATVIPNTPYIA
jgi:hypothetical protein